MRAAFLAIVIVVGACARAPNLCGAAELSDEACAGLQSLVLPEALAPAWGNAQGDHDGAAYLGFRVFFDARFSANQEVRCATCHAPEHAFQDARATAQGLRTVSRNSPTVLNAARLRRQFWDGRVDLLWAQPLGAFEHPDEMGITRLALAHRIKASFEAEYQAAFGPLPPLDDPARFPAAGKPGDAPFDAMTSDDQREVNRVAANVGKALEAYLRKAQSGRAPFDAFLLGARDALSEQAQRGLGVFVRAGCLACHSGPALSDERLYDLGLGASSTAAPPVDALFTERGPFYEGAPAPALEPLEVGPGRYRTAPLRNVGRTAPYAHDGRFASLEEAIDAHPLEALSASERSALVALLRSLDGELPPAPWNDWPER